MEAMLSPERLQPSFGEEISSTKSISYSSIIPPHSRKMARSNENKLRRKWTKDDVEDHITDVRLDAAMKRAFNIEQSDKTKSWRNMIDGTEYLSRSMRWSEDERLVHSYEYVFDSNVTIFGDEELDEPTEEEIDKWFDQPYSEDLENDASNLFEDGEDFFDTFKWESRVNAKRHWKVAGTPWQNVVDGIPESYRFVRWEQHSDVEMTMNNSVQMMMKKLSQKKTSMIGSKILNAKTWSLNQIHSLKKSIAFTWPMRKITSCNVLHGVIPKLLSNQSGVF